MKQVLFILFIGLFVQPLQAQFKCGFEAVMEQAKQADPLYRTSLIRTSQTIQQIIADRKAAPVNQRATNDGGVISIPVVVHVIHTGGTIGSNYNPVNAQIQGAIDYLNAVFEGTWTGNGGSILGAGNLQIRFVLATRDPNNNPTSGIVRVDGNSIPNYAANGVNVSQTSGTNQLNIKDLSRWDPFRYYNIWLVNKIDGCDGLSGCGSFISGFAYFPFVGPVHSIITKLDGTVMLATQMVAGQKTLPHELGHAFNLHHPFHGEIEQAGLNGCPSADVAQGDECADTNPVTNPADDGEATPFACRTGTSNCYSLPYNANTEQNFMNYTSCYRLFTNDQKERMQAAAVATVRASQASSWANNEEPLPTIWSAPRAVGTAPVSLLTTNDVAGIVSVSLDNRTIHSLSANHDGGYVDNANKWYNLFYLQRNTSYTLTVKFLGVNAEQLGVWIDYDNNGVFGPGEQIFLETHISPGAAAAGVNIPFTTPATASGSIVRMRIIEDLSVIYGVQPITSSSTSLVYGQAEDYPVFIQTGVLPLTLVRFDGKRENNRSILNWATEQEEHTKEFVVEAAPDGISFRQIGIVAARPGSQSNQYRFIADNLPAGTWFFRLKMMDRDNSHTYSKTIRLQWNTMTPLEVIGNPFRTQLTLQLPAAITGNVLVQLLDMNGKAVHAKQYRLNQQTQLVLRLDDGILSTGMYLLETIIGNDRYSNKVIKQ